MKTRLTPAKKSAPIQDSNVIVPAIVTVIVIVAGTVAHGYWTGRWSKGDVSEELKAMAVRIDNIPKDFGEWQGTDAEATELDRTLYEKAGAIGHLDRQYKNTRTGKVVKISLICSERWHMVQHTPDRCYVGAGFEMKKSPERTPVETPVGAAEFLTSTFTKKSDTQCILWSFMSDGEWISTNEPAIGLIGTESWYKLYVTTPVVSSVAGDAVGVCKEFARDFIPVANGVLLAPADSGGSSDEDDGDTES